MSTNGNIPILEEMIIGTAEELDHSRTYSIFLRGKRVREVYTQIV